MTKTNTGDWNAGNCNTGNWNRMNNETGYFNSEQASSVRVFNKECSVETWRECDKPDFIYQILLTKWICEDEMSEIEKRHNPTYKTTEGYLKTWTWEEAWQNAWNEATPEDRNKLWNLPNFDKDVFKEITGIDVEEDVAEELTMEQVCKELGREVKIKK